MRDLPELMKAAREGGPAPQRRDALLLLPELPGRAVLVDSESAGSDEEDTWSAAAAAWGVELVGPGAARGERLALGSSPRALAATGAATLLLAGADDGTLARAGYATSAWVGRRTAHDAPALVPVGDRALAQRLRTNGLPRRPRQVAADLLDTARGRTRYTVACRSPSAPLALSAAGVRGVSSALLSGAASYRRRPVFLVPDAGEAGTVVKIGRGADAEHRGRAEQRALGWLRTAGVPGVPEPRGSGAAGPLIYSAEGMVPGRPALRMLADLPTSRTRALLDALADAVDDLHLRTRGDRSPDDGLWLPGDVPVVETLRPAPGATPGVLVHGDLHGNLLTSRAGDGWRVGMVDWELARVGLPLHDMLPMLCKGLLSARRVGRDDAAGYLIETLEGAGEDGRWLVQRTARSLDLLGVSRGTGARLASLALLSWAAKRVVHDQRVLEDGGTPTSSRSAADEVAAAWLQRSAGGLSWPALEAASAV
jgi:hypothetical protein